MKISNWNGRPVVENAHVKTPSVNALPDTPFCPRGNGRSYGDASLQKTVLDLTTLKKTLRLDGDILDVSAGFTVGEILNFIVPKGFLLPVIPGTQHVTVGGMIAADVHGKNHVKNGTIGRWIQSIEIQLCDGRFLTCDSQKNNDLLEATIGGLGLTGVILFAKIKLIPLVNDRFQQKIQAFGSVTSLLTALEKSTATYKTGWFDGYKKTHCLLLENDLLDTPKNLEEFALKKPKITIPFKSFSFVQPWLMRTYNRRYFSKTQRAKETVSLDEGLFPLDRIRNWNYLYGTKGFYQLQWSFEKEGIEAKLNIVFDAIESSSFTPVLCVVKQHGELTSPGLLSFPKPGFSFALDFTYQKGLAPFLIQLNQKIADAGGRVYLVKDALLEAATFEQMYPEATEFKTQISKYNNGRIASFLSKRLNLTP